MDVRNDLLCVPMHVEALMVGTSPASSVFVNIVDGYDRLALNPLGVYVPTDPMNTKTTEKPGIHISWLLPEGLRQGFQTDGDHQPHYPQVPERWIVTRLWCSKDEPEYIQSKQWMVESDALEKQCDVSMYNEDSLTFPQLDDEYMPFRILGRSYPYGMNVPEPVERLIGLHAMGPGNPAFSAMYPYHMNVFGLYDDLLDEHGQRLTDVSLSYTVRGYYRNDFKLIETAEECEERYGWSAPEELQYPASLVLHGGITDLPWVDDHTDYNEEVINNLMQPQLAFGNTSVEAVSALYGMREHKDEQLMHILFNDQSDRLLHLNGMYKTDYAEHERRFHIFTEQTAYALRARLDHTTNQIMPNMSTYEVSPRVSDDDQQRFRKLQAYIENWHQMQFTRSAQQSALYDLWYKYMIQAYMVNPDSKKMEQAKQWMDVYERQIKSAIEALEKLDQALEQMKQEIDKLANELSVSVEKSHELQQTAGSRYYEPNAPVLMLANASRGTSIHQAWREDGRLLPCRLLSEALRTFLLEFELRGIGYAVQIDGEDLLAVDKQWMGEYAELLLESLWFSAHFVDCMIAAIARKLDISSLTEEERSLLQQIIFHKKNEIMDTVVQDEEKSSTAIRISLHEWKAPWNPVLLSWRGLYYPDPNLLADQPNLDNWTFNETDYTFQGEGVDTHHPVVLQGQIFLTPHIAELMEAMATKQFGDDLPRRMEGLKQADYLSQALDGFNAAFLMKELALSFPIFVMDKGDPELAGQVASSLADYALEHPRFESFFAPIRGGFFKLDQLKLIDTFGQAQDIECQQYAVSEDMRRDEYQVIDSYVMLPPRFIQPTRLDFHWLQSSTQEFCDFSLDDSPICGWMIPNHTDQSLMIYDESGVMLGSLITTAFENRDVQWRTAPGISQQPAAKMEGDQILSDDVPDRMNAEMKAFVHEILRQSSEQDTDVLTPFLEVVDSAMWAMDQQSSSDASGLSLFVGKPLVLTRAQIKLVQAGPSAQSKIMESGEPGQGQSPNSDATNLIDKFHMPLWIGEKDHTGDGAVGFFVLDGEHNYKQFHSAFITEGLQDKLNSDYFQSEYTVDISADATANGTTIALILDPFEAIHLRSGMLPVSEQRIPTDRIESGMEQLYLTLYTGPLLLGEEGWLMPLTRLPEREWSFITPGDDKLWIEIDHLQPANGNAFLAKPPFRAVEGWLKLQAGGKHGAE